MKISVVIPTYNERDNIGPLVENLVKSLPAGHEIIFVDDCSPDGTSAEVEALSLKFPSVRLIRRKGKEGLTSAIQSGVKASRGESILVMDADLSHPPEAAQKMISSLKDSDLVVGTRLAKGGGVESWPLHRKLISKGADILARLVLGSPCSDPLSGFFVIRKDIFSRTRIRTKGYKLLLNILYDNPGMRITEVPYVFRDRHAGRTKLGLGEIANYLFDLLRIRFG